MIKPNTWRPPWKHILCWAIYLFLFVSMPFYGDMLGYGLPQWCNYTYSLIAPMAFFYAAAYFAGNYLNRYGPRVLLEEGFRKKVVMLAQWQVFAILLVGVAFLTLTLILDNKVFGLGYRDFHLQWQDRLTQTAGYIAVSSFYALLRWRGHQPGNGDVDYEDGGGQKTGYRIGASNLNDSLNKQETKN